MSRCISSLINLLLLQQHGLNKYISELVHVPTGVKDLAGLIAFNEAHADLELVPPYWTSQSQYVLPVFLTISFPAQHQPSRFITSQNSSADQAYYDAIIANRELGGKHGIDATLHKYGLDALLLPTLVSSMPAAIAGYPIVMGASSRSLPFMLLLTLVLLAAVPLGFLPPDTPLAPAEPTRISGPNQPFGIAFIGTAWTEFELILYAYAYEQATHTRLKVRAFPEAVPTTQLADVVGGRFHT